MADKNVQNIDTKGAADVKPDVVLDDATFDDVPTCKVADADIAWMIGSGGNPHPFPIVKGWHNESGNNVSLKGAIIPNDEWLFLIRGDDASSGYTRTSMDIRANSIDEEMRQLVAYSGKNIRLKDVL